MTKHRCSDLHCYLTPVAERGRGWGTNNGCMCLKGLTVAKTKMVIDRFDELFMDINKLEHHVTELERTIDVIKAQVEPMCNAQDRSDILAVDACVANLKRVLE